MKTYILEPTFSFLDYPDPNVGCITVYVTGCLFNCKNCHNKSLQEYGRDGMYVSISEFSSILTKYSNKYRTNKVCIMGGEPSYQKNIKFIKKVLINLHTIYDFCIYTGSDIIDWPGASFIKTGLYDDSLKQPSCKTDSYFILGSTNQKLYSGNGTLLSENGIYYF